jgi:hypothetical protein
MKTRELLEGPSNPSKADIAPDETGYALNIAGVYQDTVTRDWAVQSFVHATRLAEDKRIHNKWYDVDALSDSSILLEAVGAALVADVIVISVYAAEVLPLNLYVWITAWLPRRTSRVGALAALVGVAEPLDSPSVGTIDYLQAVAHRAQLDFVPHARRRTVASPVSLEPVAAPAGAGVPSLLEQPSQGHSAWHRWGLNE